MIFIMEGFTKLEVFWLMLWQNRINTNALLVKKKFNFLMFKFFRGRYQRF